MLTAIFYITIGIFIGWNLDQPDYAKNFQALMTAKWAEFRATK